MTDSLEERDAGASMKPVEPPATSRDPRRRREFFGTDPMRAADALRKALPIDEATYTQVVGHIHADARAFFLYGAMDEVHKASTAIMRWAEFLEVSDEERKAHEARLRTDEAERHMHRVVVDAVLDEQQMWVRKLNELLCDMILFRRTNDQNYYRLYLACRFLDTYLGLQQDFEEFYACRSGNADVTIRMLLVQVGRARTSIDPAKPWFLRPNIDSRKPPAPGNLFTSARRRFMLATQAATAGERVALGISYETGYSVPSRAIHGSIGAPWRETEERLIDTNIGRVGIVASHIALLGYKLAGIQPAGTARQISEVLDSADAPRKIASILQAEFDVGDVVAVYGDDLCEIVDSSKSKYGYTSYKVRYLTRPPLGEVPEDWFTAREIRQLVIPRKALRGHLATMLLRAGAAPADVARIEEVSEAELSSMVARTIKDMETQGVLQLFLRRKTEPPPAVGAP